ncbi:hypothetical protein M9979_02830 [Sphingomonas sp. RP10(2022)]|uniref:Uncharacterized protein n=1 Tax=Sphingomonas liriopis TaxID=2949094 RepID=A0A9X2HQX2_9SPHN|nr:hypothetical protein [Sphingomonas liriopis]MCP3733814.1 hypothetical protein [Sphingomonas liriopis]
MVEAGYHHRCQTEPEELVEESSPQIGGTRSRSSGETQSSDTRAFYNGLINRDRQTLRAGLAYFRSMDDVFQPIVHAWRPVSL